jgi:hypothetical protein
MDTFTIAAAARHCGVARRTLQRAIAAGRLPLTPDHRLTLTALEHAGYVAATATQRPATATPQRLPHPAPDMSQTLAQALTPLLERLDRLITVIEVLCAHLHAPPTAGTPQRRRAAARRSDTPGTVTPQVETQAAPQSLSATQMPAFDASKFMLGKLCPRGHDYHGSGHTLRRLPRHVCPICDVERTRESRRAKRKGTQ